MEGLDAAALASGGVQSLPRVVVYRDTGTKGRKRHRVRHCPVRIFVLHEDTAPMALIAAYFDDSGTDLKSAVAVAACYISDVRRWDRFAAEWKSVLSDAGILGCGFHMADFVAHKPPFDAWERAKRDDVIRGLVSTIGSHALDGMVTAVIKSDYDRFVTGKLREKLGGYHYTFAVQSCLDFIEKWRGFNSREPIQFIFDQMGKGRGEINDLFDSLIERKR